MSQDYTAEIYEKIAQENCNKIAMGSGKVKIRKLNLKRELNSINMKIYIMEKFFIAIIIITLSYTFTKFIDVNIEMINYNKMLTQIGKEIQMLYDDYNYDEVLEEAIKVRDGDDNLNIYTAKIVLGDVNVSEINDEYSKLATKTGAWYILFFIVVITAITIGIIYLDLQKKKHKLETVIMYLEEMYP